MQIKFTENLLLGNNTSAELIFTSFENKSAAIYKKASQVMYKFFCNTESKASYMASKEVVEDVLEIILDDDFNLESLQNFVAHGYHLHTHSINVSIYALILGNSLKLTFEELKELGEAALLHDLGKSKIDTKILNKNGKLTTNEFQEMKKHSSFGCMTALRLEIKNRKIRNGIRQHHEKMDGSGYPFGLKGEEISFYARIICLCDIFDALTSKRSYKEPMTHAEAFVLIETKMSGHVDSVLLQKMIEIFM